jgi:hypothetical protein
LTELSTFDFAGYHNVLKINSTVLHQACLLLQN